ncbi:hypothetical protein BH09PAT1_BH09PAT1_8080 [soil metagenome]
MIDTIIPVLDRNKFRIINPDVFEPSARWIDDVTSFGSRGYAKSKQNPTPSELNAGNYQPRLTLSRRFNRLGQIDTTLKIEVSLPKLLFNNNFDELTDSNYDEVLNIFIGKLKDMSVIVSKIDLENALVSTVHFSKNIPLTDGTTPYQYIKKISEGNYKLTSDTDKVNYRNHGQLFKLHTNSWEHVIYDKIREFEKAKVSDKRCEENETAIQLGLFEDKTMTKPFEVLRLEARYNRRAKIRQVLKGVGFEFEPTLKNLFNGQTSQKVLLQFLKELELARPVLLDYKPSDEKALLPDIVINNPTFPPRKVIMLYGLKLAMDRYDMRELRKIFAKYNHRSWYRLVNECQNVELPIKQDTFKAIREKLYEFKPLKLADFTI